MNQNFLIAIVVVSIIVVIYCAKLMQLIEKTREHLTNESAITNVANLYNKGTLNLTDLVVTGKTTIGGINFTDYKILTTPAISAGSVVFDPNFGTLIDGRNSGGLRVIYY